jgi:hypothetical protein
MARLLGADATLAKPFATSELVDLCEQLLGQPPDPEPLAA